MQNMSYAWHSTSELQQMLQTYAGRREEPEIRAELNRRQYGGAQKAKKTAVKTRVTAKRPAKASKTTMKPVAQRTSQSKAKKVHK